MMGFIAFADLRRTLLRLLFCCIAALFPSIIHGQDTEFESIEIRVGEEHFRLTPTAGLTVYQIVSPTQTGPLFVGDGGTTFAFEYDVGTHERMTPAEANAAWRHLVGDEVHRAVAFSYALNCALPSSLAALCDHKPLQRLSQLLIKGHEAGWEPGTHRDRPRPDNPLRASIGIDGSMSLLKGRKAFWEGQLPSGPVAVLCDERRPGADRWYECAHQRALTPTTSYRVRFALPHADPPPTDAEWLSLFAAIEDAMRDYSVATIVSTEEGVSDAESGGSSRQ
jgi:hypothetical protein